MAVDEANEQQAKVPTSIRFQLVPQDDHGNPYIATYVANYFVKSHVSGVIGHWSSDAAFAVAKTYEQAGIPQLNFTPTNSELTSRGYKTIFRVIGSSSDTGASQAEVALDVLKGKRIVIIGNDSSYSKGLTDSFVSKVVASGRTVLQRSSVAVTTSDFNTTLKSASESQADTIFFSGYIAQAEAFLKAAKRLNLKANILLNPGASNQNFSAHDNGNLYVLEPDRPQDECASSKSFYQKFLAKYNHPPSTYSRYTYNAANLLIQVIRQVDSLDVALVAPALRKIRYAGLGGDIAFDVAGNLINPTYTLYHAEGARWRHVRFFPSDRGIRCAKG